MSKILSVGFTMRNAKILILNEQRHTVKNGIQIKGGEGMDKWTKGTYDGKGLKAKSYSKDSTPMNQEKHPRLNKERASTARYSKDETKWKFKA